MDQGFKQVKNLEAVVEDVFRFCGCQVAVD
jgi:hypothetical protein